MQPLTYAEIKDRVYPQYSRGRIHHCAQKGDQQKCPLITSLILAYYKNKKPLWAPCCVLHKIFFPLFLQLSSNQRSTAVSYHSNAEGKTASRQLIFFAMYPFEIEIKRNPNLHKHLGNYVLQGEKKNPVFYFSINSWVHLLVAFAHKPKQIFSDSSELQLSSVTLYLL